MATYNGAPYLKEQLDCFNEQSILPNELIICDDGSTDETINVIESFQKYAPFNVKFIQNQTRLGYGKNFEKALNNTTGDLIFLSDQDDVWFPNKIEEIINVVGQNPDKDLFLNDTEITDAKLNPTGLTKLGQIKRTSLSLDNFVQGSCACLTRQLADIALPIPENIKAHDNWISDIARYLDIRYIHNEVLQYYRIHERNTSNYMANRTKKLNRSTGIFNQRNASRATTEHKMNSDIHYKKQINSRLRELHSSVISGHISSDAIAEAQKRIDEYIDVLNTRLDIRNSNMITRIHSGFAMYIDGQYQEHFNGALSLTKDIFRT